MTQFLGYYHDAGLPVSETRSHLLAYDKPSSLPLGQSE